MAGALEQLIERGVDGNGTQIVRTVVDTVDGCNLRCGYCDNYNPINHGNLLSPGIIRGVLQAADVQNQLDVVVSGGEITSHPQFGDVVGAADDLQHTGTTVITNGTLLDDERIRQIRDSKISRVCISIDGPDSSTHDFGRGKTFNRVWDGLRRLQDVGKNISALTVLHPKNIDRVFELSDTLADKGLAQQHHFAAMYYSGRARDNTEKFKLPMDKIYDFQHHLDSVFDEFKRRGLYLVFNHFWPLTGQRPESGNPREMLSHQLGEQNKATWVVVRSNGDVNQTNAYWGRQSMMNPVVGNLHDQSAGVLFGNVDTAYRSGQLFQLPRATEARLKYVVGEFDEEAAQAAISGEVDLSTIDLVACRPMSAFDVMQKPITPRYLDEMASNYNESPWDIRVVQHATGVYMWYKNTTGHVILLNQAEFLDLEKRIENLQVALI